MGTPLETEASESLAAVGRMAPGEARSTIEGHLSGSARQTVGRGLLEESGRAWWETSRRTLVQQFSSPKGWVKAPRDALARIGVESWPRQRDRPLMAHLLTSGAASRLTKAMSDFERLVAQANSAEMPLRTIRVSVFGFDFGAALAKAFIRELLDKRCERQGDTYRYQDAEVVVAFAGLFDCVHRTHPDMGPLEALTPTVTEIDDGGPLHPACRRAVHLIAAHERRITRRCRPLGGQRANWREELLPGISEDVGGGLKPGEQKISAELSRYALHRMYRMAHRAGVPVPSLEQLYQRNPDVAAYFMVDDEIDGHTLPALAAVYAEATRKHRQPNAESFLFHAELYLSWLAKRYLIYRDTRAALEARLDALPERTPGGVLGVPAASLTRPAEWEDIVATAEEIEQALAELEVRWGWLKEVDREARNINAQHLTANNEIGGYARRHLATEGKLAEVWMAWVGSESARNALEETFTRNSSVAYLFRYGIHDRHADDQELQFQAGGANASVGSRHYHFFAWRGVDMPGEEPPERPAQHPRERMERWTMR
ncbi:phospholipase effector Tle1 domain-containing protein [Franzmannia pantelleriensis]|uniref:phospholipase effector Tle1 domain-containing protein n=1 Tax=Franzmannia pantelleriensis TaxID=48727 RepID=UPI0030EB1B72